MLLVIIFIIMVLLVLSGILIYGKTRMKHMRHEAFEEAVRTELLKLQQQVILDSETGNPAYQNSKAVFDARSKKLIRLFAEQFYGDINEAPVDRRAAIQKFVRDLRRQINERAPVF